MWRRRDRVLRDLRRERVMITLKSGETFDGLLEEVDDRTLVLVDAFAVAKDSRIEVDGRLYLARSDLAYSQAPEAR